MNEIINIFCIFISGLRERTNFFMSILFAGRYKTNLRSSIVKGVAILALLLPHLEIAAQVEIDEPVRMTGTSGADRQVKGLGVPVSPGNAISAQAVQNNKVIFSAASGIDTIAINPAPALNNYVAGQLLHFQAANTITGPAFVNVNNLGPVPLRKGVNQLLDSADIKASQIVSVVFDGSDFQIISQLTKSCPIGYTPVTRDYCIETDEHATATWWDAVTYCTSRNARLCNMPEWSFACVILGANLQNMENNFEWIDSAANNSGDAKLVGNSCETGGHAVPGSLYNFRCCFSR